MLSTASWPNPKHPALWSTLPRWHLLTLPLIDSGMQANSRGRLQACLRHPAPCFTADLPKSIRQTVAGLSLSMNLASKLSQRSGIPEYFFANISHSQDGHNQSDQFCTKTIAAKVNGLFLSTLLSKCHRRHNGPSALWLLPCVKACCKLPLLMLLTIGHLYFHLANLFLIQPESRSISHQAQSNNNIS